MIQDILPKIVCLTLENARERQLLVAQQFERLGIRHYEFFPGYPADSDAVRSAYEDGRVKRYPSCFRCGMLDCGNPDCNNVLIPPQVAVALGFRDIFRAVAASDSNVFAICEDDIVFANYAAELLDSQRFRNILESIEIDGENPVLLRMTWPNPDTNMISTNLVPDDLAVTRDVRMSNPFFVANRAFAEIAYRRLETIDHTADVIVHEKLVDAASCWSLNCPLVIDRSWSLGEVPSLIHPKTKHLEHLSSQGQGFSARFHIESERLQKHRKKAVQLDYRIVGSPRCGSHYVAAFLRRNGIMVQHEMLDSAGICAWQYSVSDGAYPYISDPGAQSDFFLHFRQTLLYTRSPATAIASLIVENAKAPLSYGFRRRHIQNRFSVCLDDFPDPVEKAAMAYAYWHLIALDRQPEHILRVEHLLDDCRNAFSDHEFIMHEIPPSESGAKKPYLGFVYPPAPLEADWLNRLSESSRGLLRDVANRLGYKFD